MALVSRARIFASIMIFSIFSGDGQVRAL